MGAIAAAVAWAPSGAAAQEGGPDATGTLVGRVVETAAGPAEGVLVMAGDEETTTGPDGRFRVEDAVEGVHQVVLFHPEHGTDTVRAPVADGLTTGLDVTYSPGGTATATTHLGGLPASSGASAATADPSRGDARVVGRLLDRGTDRPIGSAGIRLPAAGLQTRTSDQGRFTLDSVPPGRHTIRIHHVRYGDRTAEVDVPDDRTVDVELRLSPDPVEVEPLEVAVDAEVRAPALTGADYYQRRRWAEKQGFGHFLEASDIEPRGSKLSHVLASLPQMTASGQVQVGGQRVTGIPYFPRYSEGPFGICLPAVYLDGHKVIGSESPSEFVGKLGPRGVNSLAPPGEVAGIEVYESPAATAGDFQASDSRCGVIAIWTKRQ